MSYQENKLMNLKDGRLLLQTLDERMKITGFAPVMTNPYPDTIKTLENCADGMGMGIEIPIAPVQDLHGYSFPWVSGAGKNIAPVTVSNIKSANTLGTWVDNVYTQANVEFTILTDDAGNVTGIKANGTPNANLGFYIFKDKTIPTGTYTLTGNPVDATTSHDVWLGTFANDAYRDYDYGTGATVTLSSDTTLSLRFRIASGSQVSNIEIKPMLRLSTETDATFAPYSNICPISGFDGVDIIRTGKNLAKTYTYSGTGSGVTFNYDGEKVTLSNTATASSAIPTYSNMPSNAWFVLKPGTYIPSVHGSNNVGIQVCAGTASKQVILSSGRAFTVSEDTSVFMRVYTFNGVNYGTSTTVFVQLERGTVASDYEAYNANTYSLTWESSTGTVYGGTVTINEDGSGKLIVDRKKVNVSDCNWTYVTSDKYFWTSIPEIKRGVLNVVTEKLTSDSYVADIPNRVATASGTNGTMSVGIANPYLMIRDYRFTDNTTFKQNSEASVVYELASPVEYTLTSQQITSLFGTNTVWNSIGVFSMSYHLDPKVYVDDTAGIAGSVAVTDSTEAEVKTLSDGADNLPMEVSVAINPVQDTHGLDPYPAGAGKNLCPYTEAGSIDQSTGEEQTSTEVTRTGFIKVTASGTYTLSNIATTNRVRFFEYNSSKTYLRTYASTDTISDGKLTFTVGNDVGYIRIQGLNAVFPNENAQVESGSTATSYMPYSNICPISGWDSVNITRTGKNLFNVNDIVKDKYISSTGAITDNVGTSYCGLIPVKEGTYTISITLTVSNNTNTRIHGYDANGNWDSQIDNINTTATGTVSKTFTVTSEIKFIRIAYRTNSTNIQIEEGSSATDYESFGKTYPISLPTTAYGGTLTVNRDGSGTLVVDKLCVLVNSLTWTYESTYVRFKSVANGIKQGSIRTIPFVTSAFISIDDGRELADVPNNGIYAAGGITEAIYIKSTDYSDATDFVNAYGTQQIVYPLNTSVTYTFTAQQIRSLLGENNLWADSGNVLNVVYYADTKMYIDDSVGNIDGLPSVSSSDNGKVLRVVDGEWAVASLPSANGVNF